MAVYRAQIAFGADSAFPRDRIAITPHFSDTGGGNGQTLCDDLATKFETYFAGTPREISVKVYDALKPKPNPPLAFNTKGAGLVPATPAFRELALCLSYFANTNVKRRRGRLYIPAFFVATGVIPVRPSSVHRDALEQFVTLFATSGPASVKWSVFSRMDQAAYPITDWWVDDEWDVQRRRGLRSTTRKTGTTVG